MPSVKASSSPSMNITQLLNPSSTRAPERASRMSTRRQQKARPSGAVKHSTMKSESRREIKGQVNFPPCEEECPELIQAYKEFSIRPDGLESAKFGEIVSLPSSVPYTSSKKDFLEKTGRKSLEVFSYTFTPKGQSKEQRVLWDYNIGLVRITPFFKSYKERKNIPKKSIENNPGLENLVYSVTGGQIQAQGYWVPFEAAKAIASTFCYTIRWALVPIFGLDFPAMCLSPEDPKFKSYMVDPEIIERAEAQAQTFLTCSGTSTPASSFTPPQRPRSNLAERQQRILSPPQETGALETPEPSEAATRCKRSSSLSSFCPPTPQTLTYSPISAYSNDLSNESAHVTLFTSAGTFESRGGSAFSSRPCSRDTPSSALGFGSSSKLRKSSKGCAVAVADNQDSLAQRSVLESEAAYALVELSLGLGSKKRSAAEMEMAC